MRVVLDTNVLIAALIARGVCSDLLEHCVLRHKVVASNPILSELRRNLGDKFHYNIDEVEEVFRLLLPHMEIVEPAELEQPVCRDPDDDLVLATGIAGDAKCIITGDKDLLVLRQHGSIRILRPADFADYEARQ